MSGLLVGCARTPVRARGDLPLPACDSSGCLFGPLELTALCGLYSGLGRGKKPVWAGQMRAFPTTTTTTTAMATTTNSQKIRRLQIRVVVVVRYGERICRTWILCSVCLAKANRKIDCEQRAFSARRMFVQFQCVFVLWSDKNVSIAIFHYHHHHNHHIKQQDCHEHRSRNII